MSEWLRTRGLDHRRGPRAGPATALALAREGMHIAALDVARPLELSRLRAGHVARLLDSLAEECRQCGVEALPFAADVRDDAVGVGGRRRHDRPLERIDLLFNNAGICAYGLAHELTGRSLGRDARHQSQGRLDRRPPCDSAHDRSAPRRDHQQLVDRRPARHGAG